MLAITLFVNSPKGQNILGQLVTKRLSNNLGVTIQIKHVGFSIFNKINLNDLLLKDKKNDTLLFAGQVNFRITDWFFVKEKIVLSYIGIENAIFNLNRTDSIWNYNFLEDYFFSAKKNATNKNALDLDFKKIELRNITFNQSDKWKGQELKFSLKALNLNADEINFSKKNIAIQSLELEQPELFVVNYPGNQKINPSQKKLNLFFKNQDWTATIAKIKIDAGSFKLNNGFEKKTTPHFDANHISFNPIFGRIENIFFIKNKLTADLFLKTKEQSGLEIKSFFTKIIFTPQNLQLIKFELETKKSKIRNSIQVDFSKQNPKFNTEFADSEIDSDELVFFIPSFKNWNQKFKIKGKLNYNADELIGTDFFVKTSNNTFLIADFNKTKKLISIAVKNLSTTYSDLVRFFPSLSKSSFTKLSNFSQIRFSGNVKSNSNDLETDGIFYTNLGTIHSSLKLELEFEKEKTPIFSAIIESENFDIGKFIGNVNFGNTSFKSIINGRGLTAKPFSATISSTVSQLFYKNYTYKKIEFNGTGNKENIVGNLSIDDENASADLGGSINFKNEIPIVDFNAQVKKINFKPLNFYKEDLSLKGNFRANFSGNNFSDFLGYAKISNATFKKKNKVVAIDSILLKSQFHNQKKSISLNSDEFDGDITGDFSIEELPSVFHNLLQQYYPSLITTTKPKTKPQDFSFNFKTNYVDDLLNFFDSSLHGFNGASVDGFLNSTTNQSNIKIDLPAASYKNYQLQNLQLLGRTNFQKLELTGSVDQLDFNEKIHIPFTKIELNTENDLSKLKIETQSTNKNIPSGSIQTQIQSFADGVSIRFDSSRFVINGKTWRIEKEGKLELRSNSTLPSEIVLKESNQEINIKTNHSSRGNWNDVFVELKKINLGDIAPYLIKSNQIEGLATGSFIIENPTNEFDVSGKFLTEELQFENDSIGKVESQLSYNGETGKLIVTGKNSNPSQKINYNIDWFLNDSAQQKENSISIFPENYPIKIVEKFIGNLFSDLTGYASGNLKIISKGRNQQYIGKLRTHDAGLKILFTNCTYNIQDSEIEFREDALDLGTLKLIDPITKQTATLSKGIIKHDAWRKLEFDIRAAVDNLPIQVLNTTEKDNKDFFGNAKGIGTFTLKGTESNLLMKVVAAASSRDSSYITIPNISGRETGVADFLIEKKYGREMRAEIANKSYNNFKYDIDVTGNPMVNVKIIPDEITGDEIRGRGEGNLRLVSSTTEPLSIHGRYLINEGNYLFTFQSFFKKPFELKKNAGNYIEWNGDPYKAKINIDAVYKTDKKVDFSPLTNNTSSNSIVSGFRDFVFVVAKLRGDLFNPTISFELDLPPESAAKKDMAISFLLNQIQNNENELNKQVAFLVVFNSFAPNLATTPITNIDLVVNSISGLLSGQINAVLNNLLSQKLKIPGLFVNFSGSLYNPNPFKNSTTALNYDRTNLNVNIAKTLFDDRVVLTYEGNFDLPVQSTTQIKTELLTNFSIEYLINKSGSIRATIFHKENADFLSTNTTSGNKSKRFGGSLTFRREFNKLRDFFKKPTK